MKDAARVAQLINSRSRPRPALDMLRDANCMQQAYPFWVRERRVTYVIFRTLARDVPMERPTPYLLERVRRMGKAAQSPTRTEYRYLCFCSDENTH